ncbi:hypothetical protein FRB91_012014 [Serendipita sp. 411]|nr:hypothetical protein FRB91_012014 [Serendipita sp. 411]
MSVGDRICHNSELGTIRFVGTIEGKPGQWLGIEWDDPSRGKGDGSINGLRYFQSRSPTGASFLRPSAPSLHFGRTFIAALREKYLEDLHATSIKEAIVLGSSDGAIEVEAVDMNKVRNKFAQLEKLKEVGLENYMISKAGPAGEIKAVCPNIRRLDLSRNLFASWSEIIEIVEQIHALESLTLHYNVFRELSSPLTGSCRSVVHLSLNRTGVTWEQALLIAPAFPSLKRLEIGFNDLSSLDLPVSSNVFTAAPLELLALDGNTLAKWNELVGTIKGISTLHTLMLTTERGQRAAKHPRWSSLVKLHGEPAEEAPSTDTGKLQDRMMTVEVYRLSEIPQNPSHRPQVVFQQTLQVLPNMPIKTLRLKLLKILKAKPATQIRVFVKLRRDADDAGVWGEVDLNLTRQSDLVWWGIENGCHLGVALS